MVLNGLKGSELVIYNWLILADKQLSKISICDLSALTSYHPRTVERALKNLDQKRYVERRRKCRGQKYEYRIVR